MRLKLFIFFLLLIGVIASFYIPSRIYRVQASLYLLSASPYNYNWTGTSMLYNALVEKNYTVVIADTREELLSEAEKGGLVLIIAPDIPLDNETASELYQLYLRGRINILVADENVTSNALLEKAGVTVDGRGIFGLGVGGYTPYPVAELMDPEGNSYVFRLNWASFLRSRGRANIRVMGTASAAIDMDDDGAIGLGEGEITVLNVAALAESRGGGKLYVVTDSFPFINQAFLSKKPYRNYSLAVIEELAKGGRIIIDNTHYRKQVVSAGMLFHPAIILYVISGVVASFDRALSEHIASSEFISLVALTTLTAIGLIFYRMVLGVGRFASLNPSPVEETVAIAETEVRKLVVEKGLKIADPRKTVTELGGALDYVFRAIMGGGFWEYVSSPEGIDEAARRLGVDREAFERKARWMLRVYRKARGETRFPLIIRWRSVLVRFIRYMEEILESMGYTLTREKGYRGIEYVLKR